MIQIVSKYLEFTASLEELIKSSPYKTSHFYKTIGLSKVTFYRKLKNKSFTADEVFKLTQILFPKEALMAELRKDIEEGRMDYEQGRFINHDEAMKDAKEKFL